MAFCHAVKVGNYQVKEMLKCKKYLEISFELCSTRSRILRPFLRHQIFLMVQVRPASDRPNLGKL